MALETIRVGAHTWNDQPAPADPLQDGDDVQRQDADEPEYEEERQHAAESPRPERDDADDDDEDEHQDELGGHQYEPVFGVPLHFRVALFDDQRDGRQQPEVGEHDHQAAVRRGAGVRHPAA